MRSPILLFCIALMACSIFAGCSKRERVGGDYVLIRPATTGPDHHPGISLYWKGGLVWGNVYAGYFDYLHYQSNQFYHDGMLVFVGPVPHEGDWWGYAQLFAVRGSGPPVILSERLLGEPLVVSSYSRSDGKIYAVESIAPTNDGVRVRFTHSPGTVHSDPNFIPLPWTLIRQLLDEAYSSSKLVRDPLGDYRVLPLKMDGQPSPDTLKRPNQSRQPTAPSRRS